MLQVVPPSMAGTEHFTMSASGVVHLVEGETSESIPLSVWVQRKSVYNLLKGITFFGKFPLVKVGFPLSLCSWQPDAVCAECSQGPAPTPYNIPLCACQALCAEILP